MYKIAELIDSVANRLEKMGLFKEAYELDVIANTIEAFLQGSQAVVDDKKMRLEFDKKKNRYELQFPDLSIVLGPSAALPLTSDEDQAKEVFEYAKQQARGPGNIMDLYNNVLKHVKGQGVANVR